ncbi:MAG: acyltransferase [Oligoflexia bacterium]|nr:acyltransferase [Oligoflexia bacterium]
MKIKYFSSVKFIWKGMLGYVAYVSIFPAFLSPLINRLRGVKIKNIFKTYIAPNVLIDSLFPELVTIEDYVYITRGVKIICHTNYTPPIQKILNRENTTGPVHIKEGAFIGVNSIIMPNVTIGKCAIVAAGSVVTNDVEDFSVVGGNPAKFIKKIRERQ